MVSSDVLNTTQPLIIDIDPFKRLSYKNVFQCAFSGRSRQDSPVEKKTISTATTATSLGPPPPPLMAAPGEDDTRLHPASGSRFLFREL